MAKRRLRKHTFPPKRFFLYINEDGSPYKDASADPYAEIPEDRLPDNVWEFWVDVRVLPASYTINSTKFATEMFIRAQMRGADAEAGNTHDFAVQEMLQALVRWNLSDDAENEIPITKEALESLEPGWLYDAIEAAHKKVNSLGAGFR